MSEQPAVYAVDGQPTQAAATLAAITSQAQLAGLLGQVRALHEMSAELIAADVWERLTGAERIEDADAEQRPAEHQSEKRAEWTWNPGRMAPSANAQRKPSHEN